MMSAHRVPLIDLVSQGLIDDVRDLLISGCDVNETDDCGNCAVTMCVDLNRYKILQLLIEETDVNVDVTDSLGRSALSRAEKIGHFKVAKLIKDAMKKKIKANVPTQENQSGLKEASSNGLRFYDKHVESHKTEKSHQTQILEKANILR